MERKRGLSWLADWRVLLLCGGGLFAGFLLGMLIFGSPWHLPPAWGDIPTWITAIATMMLALFAIVTAYYARQAFFKQSQEVRAIEQQVKDQEELTRQQAELLKIQSSQLELQREQLDQQQQVNERDVAERRRAQAARVYTGITRRGGVPSTCVVNASGLPIYDVQVLYPWLDEEDDLSGEYFGLIAPDTDPVSADTTFETADEALASTIVTFRDAAGFYWLRLPDGFLVEQTGATTEESVRAAIDQLSPRRPDHA
jgi:multidrug efflux pump subunit AcrA (membrane-fusion protein)